MRTIVIHVACAVSLSLFSTRALSADSLEDHSTVAADSQHFDYISDVFAFKGRPLNQDADRPVIVIINHGYMLGFSPARKQPVWAAYRVSRSKNVANYERPHFFYDDIRVPSSARIGTDTFGGGYDRGHMVPNFAINTQYGKLAQLETFFMSNICPQRAALNQGLWARLEKTIVNQYAPAWDQVWVITGPIFGENPKMVAKLKDRGVNVPIPSHFYIILVDTYGRQNKTIGVLAMKFPQDTPRDEQLDVEFIISIDDLEKETKLNFFPKFTSRQQPFYEKEKAADIWRMEEDE